MHKFAHMADVHLGAHREPALQRLELRAFDEAMERIVASEADFVVISGDLFHVGIPDLGVVNSALRRMVKVKDAGVEIYTIYGSHDYTPNGTSVIDILDTAGVVTNAFRWKMDGNRLLLDPVTDGKTGAKIAGISARKIGLESRHYEVLDRKHLEDLDGFKIFAFHSGLTEFKPPHLSEMETIGVSMLPRGFDYYAGGHIHQRGEFTEEEHKTIVFPGPLFTGYGKDIEDTSKGEPRGFYMVEFDDRLRRKEFVPLHTFEGVYREYDCAGRNSVEAGRWILGELERLNVAEKVVVLKAFGVMSGGRVADMDFAGMRGMLEERGALHVMLNRNGLGSAETRQEAVTGEDSATIEKRLFTSEIGKVRMADGTLTGERGASTGVELLRVLRQPPKLSESKRDYSERMVNQGMKILGSEGKDQ